MIAAVFTVQRFTCGDGYHEFSPPMPLATPRNDQILFMHIGIANLTGVPALAFEPYHS